MAYLGLCHFYSKVITSIAVMDSVIRSKQYDREISPWKEKVTGK